MNILVPSIPKRFQITQTMLEELLYDPVMAVWVFFGVKLDAFQGVRTRLAWFTPNFEDSSGFSSAKTVAGWLIGNLRPVLMPEHTTMVIYPTFGAGKKNFWRYYNMPSFSTPLWRAQLGKVDMEGDEDGKANSKAPEAWTQHFKNGSQVVMPAPNLVNESRSLAGLRTNTLFMDEINKVYATAGGPEGVAQILGRNTAASFNKNHPIWCNHIFTCSTAELSDHPGVKRHKANEKEIKKGNPDYAQASFSYKDYSNLKCETGMGAKSFKDKFRDDKSIKTLKGELSPEKQLAEIFGVWSGHSKGWYTQEMVEACRNLGRERRLVPEIIRLPQPDGAEVVYSFGVDSAPAQNSKNDDGALVTHRAILRPGLAGDVESDWQQDFVYGRRLRNTDVDGWSGKIHEKHQDFGFEIIVLDHGGGGQWITPKLKQNIQYIHGQWKSARPIVDRHTSDIEGQPLYILFVRGEEDFKGVEGLFPEQLRHARGDNVLKELANTEFRTAIEKGFIGLPIEHNARPKEELANWPAEKIWASKCLTALGDQLVKYKVATDENGNWVLKNGSRFFFSEDRDDFHDAARNAYLGFRVYLKSRASGMLGSSAGEVRFQTH